MNHLICRPNINQICWKLNNLRNMKNQMYYISTGTGGEEMWRPMDEVTLVKGHWVNKKRK